MVARLRQAERDPGALRDHGRLRGCCRARRRTEARGGDPRVPRRRATTSSSADRAPGRHALADRRPAVGRGRSRSSTRRSRARRRRRSASPGFTDSHWLREAFGTVAYGFFPSRALDSETRRAADPLGGRARAGRRPRARRALPAPRARSPSAGLSDARAARAGGRVRGARGVPRRERSGRSGVVADVYLGYGLSAPLRRDAAPAPPEPCPLPLLACRIRAERPRASPHERGFGVGEWERDLGRRRLRGGDRGGARGDRARRRLPGEPRPAPVGAVRRRPARRSRARSRRCGRCTPRPLAGDGWAIVSASPELFLARRGDRLVTMPIKGTRPARRGRRRREGRGRARDDRRPRAQRPRRASASRARCAGRS